MQLLVQARSNYKNTMFGTKRLIGRRFADPDVQEETKTLPFKVVQVRGLSLIGHDVACGMRVLVICPGSGGWMRQAWLVT